jgi:hypothetical protein
VVMGRQYGAGCRVREWRGSVSIARAASVRAREVLPEGRRMVRLPLSEDIRQPLPVCG